MTPRQQTFEHIRLICKKHGVEFEELLPRHRLDKTVPGWQRARCEIAAYLCNERHMSTPQAGRILKRSYSTIHHLLEGWKNGRSV